MKHSNTVQLDGLIPSYASQNEEQARFPRMEITYIENLFYYF
jgi:hypothetical protein